MEWKSIHIGRFCMPLRFTSTRWIRVWRCLGQGPKIMPKHVMIYLLLNDLEKYLYQKRLTVGKCVKWYCWAVSVLQVLLSSLIIKTMKLTCFPQISYLPLQTSLYFCMIHFILKFICLYRAWLMNQIWRGSWILWFSLRQLCQVCKEAWQCLK